MIKFDKVESSILATLEEAGEDGIAALLNTVNAAYAHGSPEEIDIFRAALTRLINRGLLEIANSRDPESKRWTPLPKSEALLVLQKLGSFLGWAKSEELWIWSSPAPRAEVLLTPAGAVAAREVLTERGC